jgi:hypothetical protein
VEATKQKKKERRKKPKPEGQEGMPQHQHCPPEKCRGDKNPECHEKQQRDVACELIIKAEMKHLRLAGGIYKQYIYPYSRGIWLGFSRSAAGTQDLRSHIMMTTQLGIVTLSLLYHVSLAVVATGTLSFHIT